MKDSPFFIYGSASNKRQTEATFRHLAQSLISHLPTYPVVLQTQEQVEKDQLTIVLQSDPNDADSPYLLICPLASQAEEFKDHHKFYILRVFELKKFFEATKTYTDADFEDALTLALGTLAKFTKSREDLIALESAERRRHVHAEREIKNISDEITRLETQIANLQVSCNQLRLERAATNDECIQEEEALEELQAKRDALRLAQALLESEMTTPIPNCYRPAVPKFSDSNVGAWLEDMKALYNEFAESDVGRIALIGPFLPDSARAAHEANKDKSWAEYKAAITSLCQIDVSFSSLHDQMVMQTIKPSETPRAFLLRVAAMPDRAGLTMTESDKCRVFLQLLPPDLAEKMVDKVGNGVISFINSLELIVSARKLIPGRGQATPWGGQQAQQASAAPSEAAGGTVAAKICALLEKLSPQEPEPLSKLDEAAEKLVQFIDKKIEGPKPVAAETEDALVAKILKTVTDQYELKELDPPRGRRGGRGRGRGRGRGNFGGGRGGQWVQHQGSYYGGQQGNYGGQPAYYVNMPPQQQYYQQGPPQQPAYYGNMPPQQSYQQAPPQQYQQRQGPYIPPFMSQPAPQQGAGQPGQQSGSNPPPPQGGRCWGCNNTGHIQRDCPF